MAGSGDDGRTLREFAAYSRRSPAPASGDGEPTRSGLGAAPGTDARLRPGSRSGRETPGEFELIRRYFDREPNAGRLSRAGAAASAGSESAAPRRPGGAGEAAAVSASPADRDGRAAGRRRHPEETAVASAAPARDGPGADDVLIGIGDDAAVIDVMGPLAVATDTLVAGTHFPDGFPGDSVGYRVLAVNLSDLAAMGAMPRWATLALTLPDIDEAWLESFSRGFFELANRHGVKLVGGDLTRGPLAATVQIMGCVARDAVTARGGGRIGDDVYVTGTLGDAAAGLESLSGRPVPDAAVRARLENRFARPAACVAEGLALAPLANAAIDISDGLIADLGHICEHSDCGAIVTVERVPLSADLRVACTPDRALAHALGGGDDHELCFTAPADRSEAIRAAVRATGTRITRIGRLVAGRGVELRRGGEPCEIPASGYVHF